MFSFLKPDKSDEFKVRRAFAIQSFYIIVIITLVVFWIVCFGDSEASKRLSDASIILSSLIAAFIGNFAHYGHSVHKAKHPHENKSP